MQTIILQQSISLKPYLDYGKICTKLVGLEKTKYFFYSLKPTSITRILSLCKRAFRLHLHLQNRLQNRANVNAPLDVCGITIDIEGVK